jgi:hypothetical protein
VTPYSAHNHGVAIAGAIQHHYDWPELAHPNIGLNESIQSYVIADLMAAYDQLGQ